MIRNVHNLVRAMRLERQHPDVKAFFYGSNGQQVVELRKNGEVLAKGIGLSEEVAYEMAYNAFTNPPEPKRASMPKLDDDPFAGGEEEEEADSQATEGRRRGRPRKS